MGFGDRSTGRGTFGGEFDARHGNEWGLYGVHVRVRQRRDAALFPNYFGQTYLVCDRNSLVPRSVHARLQVSVCSGHHLCHPG